MQEPEYTFTIQQAAERVGVSAHTLRAWERRYGVPIPLRLPGNRYRLYSEQDIADIIWMKGRVDAGVAPAQAAEQLRQRGRAGERACPPPDQPVLAVKTAFFAALLRSDDVTALHVLDEAFACFSLEQIGAQIIEPALSELGVRWSQGEVSVAQEHLASSLVRRKLISIRHTQPDPPTGAPHLVAACAPLEDHEIGLTLFALLAGRRGWRVSYMGQRTPLSDLAEFAYANKAQVIAISVSTLAALSSLIPWLPVAARPPAPVVFGGRLLNETPSLHAHLPGRFLGADAVIGASRLEALGGLSAPWAPSQSAHDAAAVLQGSRLRIAAETLEQWAISLRAECFQGWQAPDIRHATFSLTDALACALAFDAPELVDAQSTWLAQKMPPRDARPELSLEHRKLFVQVVNATLPADTARQFGPLLARLAMLGMTTWE